MAIPTPARAFARTTGDKPAEQNQDGRLLQLSEEVGQRWEARAPMRKQRAAIIADGHSLAVETPYRLAARVNRLLGEVRRKSRDLRPPSSTMLRGLLEKPVITERDLTDALVKEAVIEARDFLSVEFLERGLAAARCVGRIVQRRGAALRPLGTGFLVGPGLLITNEHVLTSAETAGDCLLEMDYELNAFGPAKTIRRFALDPQKFFLVDAANDFALVAVVPRALGGPGEIQSYGWLPLDGQQGKISLVPEDMINIIQHRWGVRRRSSSVTIGSSIYASGPTTRYLDPSSTTRPIRRRALRAPRF